jgi:F-type H+-transporting ATPase subunit delta
MAVGRPSSAARRYAEALFELALRDDALDADAAGLAEAAKALSDEELLDVLRNPAIPLRQRAEVLDTVLGTRVPEPVLRLLKLLTGRGRIERLPAVEAEYRQLLDRRRGIVQAVATTAAPLAAADTETLRRKIAQLAGSEVDLRIQVDESLIGGLTVRVRDTLYDASVRGRLERLRERLVSSAR